MAEAAEQEHRSARLPSIVFAKTSSVGRTQSIGIEWQPFVGQMTRSSSFPRVPPIDLDLLTADNLCRKPDSNVSHPAIATVRNLSRRCKT